MKATLGIDVNVAPLKVPVPVKLCVPVLVPVNVVALLVKLPPKLKTSFADWSVENLLQVLKLIKPHDES